MTELLVLVLIGVGTYAMRTVFFVTRWDPPPVLARGLPFVGPAVLAAIVVPGILAPGGAVHPLHSGPAVGAALTAWLLHRRTGSFPGALLGAMVVWWVLSAVAGLL
jgi:branched-subunit amino acid transport protein